MLSDAPACLRKEVDTVITLQADLNTSNPSKLKSNLKATA
jgi:hypothetical protein